ncbi:MAG: DUF2892 domain-containing protein [Bacteroidota bacterium]
MKKNVGKTDQIIRFGISAIAAGLLATGTVALTSVAGIVVAVAGGISLFTATTSWCAVYTLFGASTCAVEASK